MHNTNVPMIAVFICSNVSLASRSSLVSYTIDTKSYLHDIINILFILLA
jgi:hypothetical protein